MRRRRRDLLRGRKTLLGALIILAFIGGAGTPAGTEELAKLLSRAPSPGSLALLAAHLNEPGVAEKLRLGLFNRDWKTRAVASRLVNLGALRDLIPDIQKALESEPEAPAAEEELRALITIGGPSLDEGVLAAERRFSPRLDATFACILARARGPHAIPIYFSVLRGWQLSEGTIRTFFRLATRGQHDSLIAASALALSRRDPLAWQAVLNVAGDFAVRLDEPVLIAALSSKENQLRGESAWYAARFYSSGTPSNAADILAALDEGERGAEPAGPELRFGSEVLRRVLGKQAAEDEDWIACLESSLTCHLDSDFEESPLIEYLTPREREAILRRNKANRPEDLPAKKKSTQPDHKEPLLHLVPGLPAGVAADLFDLESCRSTSFTRWLSLASVEFRPDGLPRRVTIASQPPKPSCQRTAHALFLMSEAPSEQVDAADHPQSYVALFDPEMYECEDRAAIAELAVKPAADVLRVRGHVNPPRLVKRVQPIYPPEARKNREQGVSVYEAIISPDGCIEDPRLLQSSTPTLDIMGMEAISRWQYRPATLDGRPVRVYLTVTVTFRLNV